MPYKQGFEFPQLIAKKIKNNNNSQFDGGG
jgi:hypothetical protein